MGHLRLGRLPKSRRWSEVIELIDARPEDPAGIAAAVVQAADRQLRELADDPSVGYCFWMLTRVASASRASSFADELARIGLSVRDDEPLLTFVSRVADVVRSRTTSLTSSGHFSELASLALRRALSETVGQQGRSLFGTSLEDLQAAFRAHSSQRGFGHISRRFFGDFLARTITSLIDRELSQHVGRSSGFTSIADSADFAKALDTHTRQSARILEEFASSWYSKHNWETKGQITIEEAQGFTAIALRKLRMDLKLGAVEL